MFNSENFPIYGNLSLSSVSSFLHTLHPHTLHLHTILTLSTHTPSLTPSTYSYFTQLQAWYEKQKEVIIKSILTLNPHTPPLTLSILARHPSHFPSVTPTPHSRSSHSTLTLSTHTPLTPSTYSYTLHRLQAWYEKQKEVIIKSILTLNPHTLHSHSPLTLHPSHTLQTTSMV